MRKLALALMASAAAVFGLGLAVHAYPPGAGTVFATPGSGPPGYTVTVKASCQPGENVTATLDGVTSSPVVCGAAGTAALALVGLSKAGGATITLTAPTTPGTYIGTTSGSVTGALGTFGLTVVAPTPPATTAPPTPNLPDTGSSGTPTLTIVAIGLFAAGAGLFGMSQVRRRRGTSG